LLHKAPFTKLKQIEIRFVMAKSVPHFHPTAKSLIYNRIQFKRETGVAGFEEKSIRMNE